MEAGRPPENWVPGQAEACQPLGLLDWQIPEEGEVWQPSEDQILRQVEALRPPENWVPEQASHVDLLGPLDWWIP